MNKTAETNEKALQALDKIHASDIYFMHQQRKYNLWFLEDKIAKKTKLPVTEASLALLDQVIKEDEELMMPYLKTLWF